MSTESDCRFLQVCLLFRFLSVTHEQAPNEGILKTELSAWQGRSAGKLVLCVSELPVTCLCWR